MMYIYKSTISPWYLDNIENIHGKNPRYTVDDSVALDRSALECIGMTIKRLPCVRLHTKNVEWRVSISSESLC